MKNHMGREEIMERYGYDYIGDFCEGLARVRKGKEWFHIRPDGTSAYEERFDEAEDFHEGLAIVVRGSNWFYINSEGQFAKDGGGLWDSHEG